MGIRIHKVLGYGLDDLSIKDNSYNLAEDPRIDPEGFYARYFKDYQEALDAYPLDRFRVELELVCAHSDGVEKYDLRLLKHQLEKGEIASDASNLYTQIMTWDPEYGDSKVIVFTPPGHSDWFQYDSIIDYYEADDANPSVRKTNRPIYPYMSWIDIRNPSRKDNLDRLAFLIQQLEEYPDIRDKVDSDKLQSRYGFSSLNEAKDNLIPYIPNSLVELIRYLRVFKDPKDIYQLRPMIYTYWA